MKKLKKRACSFFNGHRKKLLIMRNAVILLFVSVFQVFATGSYSQTTQLSLKMKDATVKEVLSEIEKQSEFYFLYNSELIDVTRKVDISAKNEKVDDILTRLFSNHDVNVVVKDRYIVLTPVGEIVGEQQQQRTVSGKVTDMGRQALPGVTVVVKGTTQGTVTNADGSYTLSNVPANATLQFSFVGMKSQEVVVGNQTSINVTLEEETIGIDEVVAIGYGTVKKSDLTGSVFQVSSEMLRTQSVTKDPIQILQGKVPGLDITTGNKPGDISTPIIRGYNSINASNAPLVVVDGAPFGGRLNDINPSEIENIDVLKDASSTAIYGSRGANGVIIITTKRSKMDGKISFSYDGYGGISKSF